MYRKTMIALMVSASLAAAGCASVPSGSSGSGGSDRTGGSDGSGEQGESGGADGSGRSATGRRDGSGARRGAGERAKSAEFGRCNHCGLVMTEGVGGAGRQFAGPGRGEYHHQHSAGGFQGLPRLRRQRPAFGGRARRVGDQDIGLHAERAAHLAAQEPLVVPAAPPKLDFKSHYLVDFATDEVLSSSAAETPWSPALVS